MQGLRMPENAKFEKFFQQVQDEAKKRKCIFFSDCGQGDYYENDLVICENLCGWLVPESMAEEFTPLFLSDSDRQHEFDDYYVFIDYKVNGNNIEIEIDDSPNDLIVELSVSNEVDKTKQ